MKVKKQEPKVKPDFKLGEPIDLRTMDTNIIIDFLEDQIKLREQPIEEHIKKQLKK